MHSRPGNTRGRHLHAAEAHQTSSSRKGLPVNINTQKLSWNEYADNLCRALCTNCATQMRFWRFISKKQKWNRFSCIKSCIQISGLRQTDYITHDPKKTCFPPTNFLSVEKCCHKICNWLNLQSHQKTSIKNYNFKWKLTKKTKKCLTEMKVLYLFQKSRCVSFILQNICMFLCMAAPHSLKSWCASQSGLFSRSHTANFTITMLSIILTVLFLSQGETLNHCWI